MSGVYCAICGVPSTTLAGDGDPDWTEEDMRAEYRRKFPGVPLEEAVVVCDDCWRKVTGDFDPVEFTRRQQGMETFQGSCNRLRQLLEELKEEVRALHQHDGLKEGEHSEVHANVQLSFRHLEDSRMRLGKAIQSFEGRGSIYDQKEA